MGTSTTSQSEANDVPDIVNRYHNRADELDRRTERSFMVPASEIESNDWDLSINRYKEVVYEEVKYAHRWRSSLKSSP